MPDCCPRIRERAIIIQMASATVMSEDSDLAGTLANFDWAESHPALILLLCGCWWDSETGDLRALPSCAGHQRDVERYGTEGKYRCQ